MSSDSSKKFFEDLLQRPLGNRLGLQIAEWGVCDWLGRSAGGAVADVLFNVGMYPRPLLSRFEDVVPLIFASVLIH